MCKLRTRCPFLFVVVTGVTQNITLHEHLYMCDSEAASKPIRLIDDYALKGQISSELEATYQLQFSFCYDPEFIYCLEVSMCALYVILKK